MPMTPAAAQAIIESFMVPVGPTGKEDPPRGWPDGATKPPPPVKTTTSGNGGLGLFTFRTTAALTPGALVGGYASVPPYWPGAKITANTANTVTVDTAAKHPSGVVTAGRKVQSDGQTLLDLGADAASIVSIVRLEDNFIVVVDPLVADHNPAVGLIGLAAGVVTPTLLTNETLNVSYEPLFDGTIPAGTPVTLAPPKDPVSGLTTGTAWAGAYRALFAAGGANAIPPVPSPIDAAEQAMKAVIDGMMSVPGLGPAALQAGALAFWGVVAGVAPAMWPGSLSATPPPALLGLSALLAPGAPATLALMACVPSNPWTPAASIAAAAIFANVLYTSSLGGLVVFAGPAAFPFL